MTRKEYYNRLTAGITDNYNEYNAMQTEYNKLDQDKKSGEYTAEYIAKNITPKQFELKRGMEKIQSKAYSDVKTLTDEMRMYLRGLDVLDPEELTDDVKILNSGVRLTRNDIQGIIDKNSENRTMIQLALRYANDNGIEGINTRYNPAESQMQTFESIHNVADVVIKWFDSPKGYNSMYNRLLGENSDIAEICNKE